MTPRHAKPVVLGALATLFTLVVFGNLTDYGTNLTFIRHVMAMDTTFEFAGTRYRAVTAPVLNHAAFVTIIAVEIFVTALAWRGVYRMARGLRGAAGAFARGRRDGIAALTAALVLWQVGLIGLGSEWFGMWMSREWSGLDNAFRYLVMTLGALIYLSLPGDAADGD